MRNIEKFPVALGAAWELLIDRPRLARDGEAALKETPQLVMWAMPTLGLVIGVAFWIVGAVIGAALPTFGGTVLWALLALFFLEWKDSARGLTLTASLIEQRFVARRKWGEALMQVQPDWLLLRSPAATLAIAGVLVAKLVALGAIFHSGNAWFIAPVLVLDFTAQGVLAMERSALDGTPVLAVKRRDRNQIWWLCIFFCLFFFILSPVALLMSFGAGFLLIWLLRGFFLAAFDGVDANLITLTGDWTQLATLLCGLILVA